MPFFPVCCNLTCHTFVTFPEQTPIFLPNDIVVLVPEDQGIVLKNCQISYLKELNSLQIYRNEDGYMVWQEGDNPKEAQDSLAALKSSETENFAIYDMQA